MNDLKRILWVEDSRNDIELMFAALEDGKWESEMVVTRNGYEALDYLYRRGKFSTRPQGLPTFILLDIKIPKVNGLEVLRRIRADAVLKTIPVVMLTSSREKHDLEASYRLGANAYVVKPLDFQQFAIVVQQIVLFWTRLNEPPLSCFGHNLPENFGEMETKDL